MTQEALNIAGQCRATASSPLAKNISVDEGNGLLTELLLDAARVIEALAQPEQEPVEQCRACFGMGFLDGKGDQCLTCNGTGEQPPQPEQEPVGYVYSESGVKSAAIQRNLPNGTPLYTSPPQRTEQKMVMWPCLIDTADFSKGTVTVVMQCEDYKVSAGTHWLSTTPPKENT